MKKIICSVIGLVLLLAPFAVAIEFQPKGTSPDRTTVNTESSLPYVADEILVKYLPSATSAAKADLQTENGLTAKKTIAEIGTIVFKLPEGLDVETAINQLKDDPRVEYAEPNYFARPTATPNDPAFTQLWGLHNTGQTVNGVTGLWAPILMPLKHGIYLSAAVI